jgi:methionyl-tRNA synthetase
MSKDIFIGGAWPYANNSLHVGHLAALLPADVIARYYRGNGDNVIYVSGTDSHGTPITIRAKSENVNPADIASYYHKEFSKNFEDLDFSYDLYTSTTTDDHKKKVQDYFKIILDNGYIYEKEEEQDYCDNCHEFLSDREIVGICPHCGGEAKGDQCDKCLLTLTPKEILDKHCKTCGSTTVLRMNKHLYFKLSAFQQIITDLINKNSNKWRKNAVNESRKYLDMGLIDRAATRQLNWGVDVPVAGYEDKKVYVWIEAVLGYLTAGFKVAESRGIDFDKFIQDREELITYFVHGKDNIPFHTIIFPALLNAINVKNQLPSYIISSEYVNMNNEKMSKSKGNLISANELLSKYNKDTIRYYMISNGPEKKDVNFSEEDLVQTHNKFLVGVLGNFINRNLSFINKKFDGKISIGTIDPDIKKATEEVVVSIGNLIEKGELKAALDSAMNYVVLGNKYYDEQKPWVQVKEDINKFNDITYTCVYMIANISNLLAPFMPNATNKIKEMLKLPDFKWEPMIINNDILINNCDILFDRIDDANINLGFIDEDKKT